MSKKAKIALAVELELKKLFGNLAINKSLNLPVYDADYVDEMNIAEVEVMLIAIVEKWAGLPETKPRLK